MNRMRAANKLEEMADVMLAFAEQIGTIDEDTKLAVDSLRFGARMCRISPKWHRGIKPPTESGEYIGVVKGQRIIVYYHADLRSWTNQKWEQVMTPTIWCHMLQLPKDGED